MSLCPRRNCKQSQLLPSWNYGLKMSAIDAAHEFLHKPRRRASPRRCSWFRSGGPLARTRDRSRDTGASGPLGWGTRQV